LVPDTVAATSGDSVRWYDFIIGSDGTPSVHQVGTVNPGVNEFDTYFPGIDIAPDGTIGLSYSVMPTMMVLSATRISMR
jgi:hypothetical protein